SIIETVGQFERHLSLTPPYDRRHPDPRKSYGIHGVDLTMLLLRGNRAVQFVASLPVYLPHVVDELLGNGKPSWSFKGMGCDVGYHSPVPMYDSQEPLMDDCPFTGGKCYYDGSSLRAEEWYEQWLLHGTDEIWLMLEHEWRNRFGDTEGGAA